MSQIVASILRDAILHHKHEVNVIIEHRRVSAESRKQQLPPGAAWVVDPYVGYDDEENHMGAIADIEKFMSVHLTRIHK